MKPIESGCGPCKGMGGHGKGADKAKPEKARGNSALSSDPKFEKGSFDGRGPGKGRGQMDEASNSAPGSESSNTKNADISADELTANPEVLQESAEAGISVSGLELEQDSDGMLTEDSKTQVNKVIGNLSSSIDSEVAAMVYEQGEGQLGTNIYTSNEREEVAFEPPDNVVYDAHTHPDNDDNPSDTDIENKIDGSEATVVPADDIVGNETGDYVEY